MASTQDSPGRIGSAPPGAAAPASSSSSPAPGPGANIGSVPYRPAGSGVEPGHSSAHAALVGCILACVVIATLAMVAFIWYRWSGVQEPTTAIIIDGDASLDGTVITVRGGRLITATLDASNDFNVPILVEPGQYVVTAERDGVLILRGTVEVKRFSGVRFELAEYTKRAAAAGTLTLAPRPPTTAKTPTGYP